MHHHPSSKDRTKFHLLTLGTSEGIWWYSIDASSTSAEERMAMALARSVGQLGKMYDTEYKVRID